MIPTTDPSLISSKKHTHEIYKENSDEVKQVQKTVDLTSKDIALRIIKLGVAVTVGAGIIALTSVFLPIEAAVVSVALTAIAVYIFACYLIFNKKISAEDAKQQLLNPNFKPQLHQEFEKENKINNKADHKEQSRISELINKDPKDVLNKIDELNIRENKELLNQLAFALLKHNPSLFAEKVESLNLDRNIRVQLLDQLSELHPVTALLSFDNFKIGRTSTDFWNEEYKKMQEGRYWREIPNRQMKIDTDDPKSKSIFIKCIKALAIIPNQEYSIYLWRVLKDNDIFFETPEGQQVLHEMENSIMDNYSESLRSNYSNIILFIKNFKIS
jgi:hypothetical protein